MPNNDNINRRTVLSLLLGAGIAAVVPMAAFGDGGSGGGGSGGSGSGDGESGGGSGDSDSGDGESGGGSNSGSGGGDDGGEDGGDDGGDDNSGPSGNSGSGKGRRDQDKARDAVLKGDAIPLSRAFDMLRQKQEGRVIEVFFSQKGRRLDYRFKIVDDAGKVISVTMDARTGRIRGLLGF